MTTIGLQAEQAECLGVAREIFDLPTTCFLDGPRIVLAQHLDYEVDESIFEGF